jgi:hypothetical protein
MGSSATTAIRVGVPFVDICLSLFLKHALTDTSWVSAQDLVKIYESLEESLGVLRPITAVPKR